jgi:SAM-dependent methyltransferase
MATDELSPQGFKAEIAVVQRPAVAAGSQTYWQVQVRNASPLAWMTAPPHGINLSYHWIDAAGAVVVADGQRSYLPAMLEAGQEAHLTTIVRAPQRPGRYQLHFDLVQEGIAWFADRGSPVHAVAVEVTAESPSHVLRWTGDCSEAEFHAACAKQDWWYHSYAFDNGYRVWGEFDIGRDIHAYGFPQDMSGMKVLDLGTGGGWFAHYFEQCGAEVTAFDVRGVCDYDVHQRYAYPPVESEKPHPDRIGPDGRPVYYSRVSQSFWIMHDLLKSKARFACGRIYDVPKIFAGEQFDLIFIGALLLHLRDPVGALQAARAVCRDRLIATTSVLMDALAHDPRPLAQHYPAHQWWIPNKACFRTWFENAGFASVDVERGVTLTGMPAPQGYHSDTSGHATQYLQLGEARV